MKSCSVCGLIKELSAFDGMRNRSGVRVAKARCKDCRKIYTNSRYYSKTGAIRKEHTLKESKPKLSPEEKLKASKANWDAWYAEWKDSGAIEKCKQEYRKEAEQVRQGMLDSGVKTCTNCNVEHSLTQFHMRNRKRKDGSTYKVPYPHCKTCRRVVNREYELSPSGKVNKKAYNAVRDRRSKEATPEWLSKEQKQQIVAVYEHMRDCRAVTGEDYHVDHIVPLRGENICGLHVPWNLQVLPAYVNITKSNKFDEDS